MNQLFPEKKKRRTGTKKEKKKRKKKKQKKVCQRMPATVACRWKTRSAPTCQEHSSQIPIKNQRKQPRQPQNPPKPPWLLCPGMTKSSRPHPLPSKQIRSCKDQSPQGPFLSRPARSSLPRPESPAGKEQRQLHCKKRKVKRETTARQTKRKQSNPLTNGDGPACSSSPVILLGFGISFTG